MMPVVPVFQKIHLSNGAVVVLRVKAVLEIAKDKLTQYEDSAKRFKDCPRGGNMLLNPEQWTVGALIRAFGKERVHHSEIVKWAAFVGLEIAERDVSNALTQLKKKKGKPVELANGKGPGATWRG